MKIYCLGVFASLKYFNLSYERPKSIRDDLVRRFGLETEEEKNARHYANLSSGDGMVAD